MNQDNKTSRRNMIKTAVVAVPAGFAILASAGTLIAAGAPPAAGALKWVPDTDATAKALKYVADATKAKREKRSGVEGKDQICSNCSLYTKQGAIDGKEAGKCLMIQGGSVAGAGWCASWAKKA
jgi:cytolysin (calcineurin-like family phosphatase)